MKCPACKKRLLLINPSQGKEYICPNEKCPANIQVRKRSGCANGYAEFYGTQEEVNNQWH